MQGQEAVTNLFCIYRDCEDLALFGDYCKAHQFQRAEAAEADNAGLRGTLRDEILRAEAAEARAAQLERDGDEMQDYINEIRVALHTEKDELTIDAVRRVISERDEWKRQAAQLHQDVMNGGAAYVAKCYTVTELQRINGELLAGRDELARKLEQAQQEIERLNKFLQTIINIGDKDHHTAFDGERWREMRHCANQALNTKNDMYQP